MKKKSSISKKKSKESSIKDIIKKSVEKIRQRFPLLEKNIIEMYVSYLVPSVCITENEFDLDEINTKLSNYIDNNINSMEYSIYEYAINIENQLRECPCTSGRLKEWMLSNKNISESLECPCERR